MTQPITICRPIGDSAFVDDYAPAQGGVQSPCVDCGMACWRCPVSSPAEALTVCWTCAEVRVAKEPHLGIVTPEAVAGMRKMHRAARQRN